MELTFPLPAHFDGVVPLAKLGERAGRKHLREQVHDPVLRDKLTPALHARLQAARLLQRLPAHVQPRRTSSW